MQLIFVIFLSVLGFVLVAKGGDIFVDSSIVIAKKLKMPTLLIGATIVSFGTTLPEIFVSSIAAAHHDTGLAASNAMGSMLCNLTLVLGIALTAGGGLCSRKKYAGKLIFAFLNIVLLIVFMLNGNVSLVECVVLLSIFVVFMTTSVTSAVKERKFVPELSEPSKFSWLTVVLFVAGAAAIALGAHALVSGVSILATEYLKIPTAVVGATVVALGTSLPELVTAIGSMKHGDIEISMGNVLGANIINGTFLVGFAGALQGTNGMQVVAGTGAESLAILISVVAIFVGLLVLTLPIIVKQRTARWQGITLVGMYALYIIYIIISSIL